MAGNSRDNDMLAYARGAARQIKQNGPGPAGALGNTGSGSPDWDKGQLPSDTTRPGFKRGGKVGKFCSGGKVLSTKQM